MPRLNGLQMLRVVAAYLIVIYHCFENLHAQNPDQFGRFVMAPLGVDLFFVISGFVMVYITQHGETPLGFLTKRVVRIVPLYWVTTICVIIALQFYPWSFHYADTSLDSILASFFFIPHADLSGRAYPLLLLGWTLNMEMLFYVLFACAIFVSKRWRVPLVVVFIAVFVMTSRTLDGVTAGFYGSLMIFEFVIGCVIAMTFQNEKVQSFLKGVPMWPFMLLGVSLFGFSVNVDLDNDARLFYSGIPATIIVAAVAAQDLFRKPVPDNPLVSVGDSSYSAYLLHEFLVVGVAVLVPLRFGYTLSSGIAMVILVVVGTVIISHFSYRWFEMPSNRWFRRKLLGDKKPKPAEAAPLQSAGTK